MAHRRISKEDANLMTLIQHQNQHMSLLDEHS